MPKTRTATGRGVSIGRPGKWHRGGICKTLSQSFVASQSANPVTRSQSTTEIAISLIAQITSAILPSTVWEYINPLNTNKTRAAEEATNKGPGGWLFPVRTQRWPSITAAMGSVKQARFLPNKREPR